MKSTKTAALVGVALICIGGIAAYVAHQVRKNPIRPGEFYPVVRVIDGDTFEARVRRTVVTVRMLGIDTPESVDPPTDPECFGKEASRRTKELLTGRMVRLDLDPKREVRDRYGRYLAYVRRDDGLFVNDYLIKNGYAREYTYGTPYFFQAGFRYSEKKAKKEGKGLWSACPVA